MTQAPLLLIFTALAQAPNPGILVGASADQAPAPGAFVTLQSLELAGKARTAHDHEIYVRADSNLYLDDELLRDKDLPMALKALLEADPSVRVVVAAEAEAPNGRVQEVVGLVAGAGISKVALDFSSLGGAEAARHLFPGDMLPTEGAEPVDDLNATMSRKEMRKLKPKRSRLPQNPYGSVDFTAYTLEWGEAKVGLFTLDYGILPRTQVGTVPLLDALGVYNADAKINFMREGRLDGALLGSFTYVPLSDIVASLDQKYDLGVFGDEASRLEGSQVDNASVGLMASVQVANPWSIHAGLQYNRLTARGSYDFLQLPTILVPGFDDVFTGVGLEVTGLSAELMQVRFASDIRFNRRDSLVLQAQVPFWANVRGDSEVSAQEGIHTTEDVGLLVTYGSYLPIDAGYRVSLAWQMAWKHWEARAGWGFSPVQYSWALGTFDLSYRFGGRTRRSEKEVRSGYRDNLKEIQGGGEQK